MGTKVQCKSYLAEYHPIRDRSEDANYSWSHFCKDKTFSGQLCNNFKPRGISGWLEYDKEMLKRTMLEHEAIFKNQVYELHRLYRIQKELMHELTKKQLNRFSGPAETSKSTMFLSQMPPEFGDKIWHLPHPPLVNNCHSTPNVTDRNDKGTSSNFLREGAIQCSSISTKNGGCIKDYKPLDTKLKTLPKRMLDLHLPAEVYIENEVTDRTERENVDEPCAMPVETLNMNHGIDTENDVKLTLGSAEVPVGMLKSNLHPRNGLSIHSLADLNEPIEGSCEKGDIGSGSHKSSGLNVCSETLQRPWTQTTSKSSFPHRNFSMDKLTDGVTLNYLNTDKAERGQEWLPFHRDSGQSKLIANPIVSGLFSMKYPMSSESIKLKLDKARESHLPDQNQTETWFGEKTPCSREISGSLDFLNSNHPGGTASEVTSPFSVVSHFSYATAASPLASCWRKPSNSINHIPIEVQVLPCFSGSSMLNGQSNNYNAAKQSNGIACDKLQCNGDLQPQMTVGSRSSSHANGLHMYSTSLTGIHHSPSNLEKSNLNNNGGTPPYDNSDIHEPQKCLKDLQFVGIKSAKLLNLNQSIPGGIQDGLTEKQNLDRKHDKSSKGLIWPREKSSCNGSADIKECHTRLDLRLTENYSRSPEYLGQEVKDKDSPIYDLKQFMSSFDVIQRSLVTDNMSSNGNLNRPDNSQRMFSSSNSVSYNGQSLSDDGKGLGKAKAVRNCTPCLRDDINLNSDLMPVDDAQLFRISAEDEMHFPSSFSLTRVAAIPTNKFDLEATADEMEEDNNTFSGVEIVDMNQPVTPFKMSQEKISSHDTCVRLAADAIVSLSKDVVHNHLDKFTCYPFAPSSYDSLHLLAEVVTSNAEIAGESKGSRYGSCETSDIDGLDVFEAMTLKLEELKAGDYCCKPCQKEEPKDEDKSMASLLLTKPCRGQARKRRQKRDFQKDILPALASLSRHEVTEDLQALGGMIRAGKSWQTSSTRRSASQNRSNFQSRGRKRPRGLVITIAEAHDSPPQVQRILTELEIDRRNMMVWGRTTRRCQRQRIPSGNASVPQE